VTVFWKVTVLYSYKVTKEDKGCTVDTEVGNKKQLRSHRRDDVREEPEDLALLHHEPPPPPRLDVLAWGLRWGRGGWEGEQVWGGGWR
jgi:hypothetical protein